MLRYLLDTSIVIDVLKRRPVEVLSTFNANSEGLVLVTNNMGEFARVPALEAENWVQTAQ